MTLTVGTAPDSWGVWFPEDEHQPPWERFLDEVVAAGYEWIELGPFGYLPTDATRLKDELGSRGLRLLAGTVISDLHIPEQRPALRAQVDDVASLVTELGGKFIVLIPSLYRDLQTGKVIASSELTSSEWKHLIDTCDALGAVLRDDYGLTLTFHSHADSPVEYAADVDRLLTDTDPAAVSLCLDTGHYEYRDGNSGALFRAHHERIPYFHLKSVDPSVKERVGQEGIDFVTAVRLGIMCEPDSGIVDFVGLATAMTETDYEGWAVVEQDQYPLADLDQPLLIAKATRQYFTSLGWS